MARCSNCGSQQLFLTLEPCEGCGKSTCPNCGRYVATMYSAQIPDTQMDYWKVCSHPCLDRVALNTSYAVGPPTIWSPSPQPTQWDQMRVSRPFIHTRPHPKQGLVRYTVSTLAASHEFYSRIIESTSQLIREGRLPEYASDIQAADAKKRAGRYEEAALIYEKWNMVDEAGVARRGAKTQYVRQVSVDLNHILEQIRKDGLSIPYKCISCGSSLRIDASTKSSALSTCGHCGSTYDRGQLTEFLSKILG